VSFISSAIIFLFIIRLMKVSVLIFFKHESNNTCYNWDDEIIFLFKIHTAQWS